MKTLDANLLKNIKYFEDLTEDELRWIIKANDNKVEDFEPHTIIFKEDEIGEHMYIILEGHVDVYMKGTFSNTETQIATLGEGDFFGENVCLTNEISRRTASIRATMQTRVFKIHKRHVRFKRDKDTDMGFEGRFPANEVRDLISRIPLFRGLTQDEYHNIDKWAEVLNLQPGQYVYEEGDIAECMYVVSEGTVELLKKGSSGNPYGIPGTIEKGEYFGEAALLQDNEEKKYENFARAKTACRLIKVDKNIFTTLVERDAALIDYMKKIQMVKKMKMIYDAT